MLIYVNGDEGFYKIDNFNYALICFEGNRGKKVLLFVKAKNRENSFAIRFHEEMAKYGVFGKKIDFLRGEIYCWRKKEKISKNKGINF